MVLYMLLGHTVGQPVNLARCVLTPQKYFQKWVFGSLIINFQSFAKQHFIIHVCLTTCKGLDVPLPWRVYPLCLERKLHCKNCHWLLNVRWHEDKIQVCVWNWNMVVLYEMSFKISIFAQNMFFDVHSALMLKSVLWILLTEDVPAHVTPLTLIICLSVAGVIVVIIVIVAVVLIRRKTKGLHFINSTFIQNTRKTAQ